MRWTAHVARMRRREVRTEFCWENLGEREYFKNLEVDGNSTKMDLKVGGKHGLNLSVPG